MAVSNLKIPRSLQKIKIWGEPFADFSCPIAALRRQLLTHRAVAAFAGQPGVSIPHDASNCFAFLAGQQHSPDVMPPMPSYFLLRLKNSICRTLFIVSARPLRQPPSATAAAPAAAS
ncbi:MAG TPA: hypothetical protein VMU43_02250 [Candidatus Acidoferrum sp.]|nr:hypothetical protein [Candidatus Acidoferrum sp.]